MGCFTSRRLIAVLLLTLLPFKVTAEQRQIEDILGRTVTVPAEIDGLILGESRFIPALLIVDPHAVARIKGMQADLQAYDPATWALYADKFPALESIPLIGKGTATTFSTERLIELEPDVALFGISGHGPSPRDGEMLAQLEAAGIPVVFIDFREAPLENTPKSVAILGQLLGGEDRAQAFARRYRAELEAIRTRVVQVPPEQRPGVFLHSKVGLVADCCETMGQTMLGRLVTEAGGRHLGAELIPGRVGNVNLEYLLQNPPDRYLATAIGSAKHTQGAKPYVSLGPDVDPKLARASLHRATQALGVRHLAAVQRGDSFAIWHHFYNSPFNLAGLAAIAKWLHPREFADYDPEALLRDLYRDFQPIPLQGRYWVSGGVKTDASN